MLMLMVVLRMMKSYLNKLIFTLLIVFSISSKAEETKKGAFSFRANIPSLCGMDIISNNGGIKIIGMETSNVTKGEVKFYNNSKDNIVIISPEIDSKTISHESLRKGYIVFLNRGIESKFPINGGEMNLELNDDKNEVKFFIDFTNLDITELSSGELDLSLKLTVSCK